MDILYLFPGGPSGDRYIWCLYGPGILYVPFRARQSIARVSAKDDTVIFYKTEFGNEAPYVGIQHAGNWPQKNPGQLCSPGSHRCSHSAWLSFGRSNQNSTPPGVRPGPASGSSGIRISRTSSSGTFRTPKSMPWASITAFTMERPMPVPP